MISLDTIPVLLLAGFAALLVAGLAVGVWGKRLPRHGDWLVGIPLAYLLVVLGMAWNALAEDHFTARVWNRGWIWPRDQVGAITVGLVIDPLGLALAALAAVMAVLYLVDLRERSPKDVGALALSAMGVMLAWTALTPWIAFCGMAAAIFGGFLSTGSRWDEEKGAVVSARFAWERCWGLLLAAVGLCILAGSRGALEFAGAEWTTQVAGADLMADWIGTSVLLLGLLVQFQPFPFFGGLVAESGQPAPARALLRQIFPGWGAFALLLRIGPRLLSAWPPFTVTWQILGWVGFASSALAVASGLMQSGWKTSLSFWISASFCAAVGVLSFAGPQAATALVLGTGLGALILAKAGDALEGKAAGKEASAPARGRWFKVATIFGASAATGMIGFVSAGGALGGLAANADNPAVLVALAFVLLLDAVLCWSFVWQIGRLGSSARAPWPSVVVTFTLVALSLGLPWTGTASGGAIPESPDALFGSLFAILFGGSSNSPAQGAGGAAEATAFVTASGAHWGGLALALLIAFWAFGRKADGEKPSMAERSPRFAEFVSSGYGVDRGIARVRATYVSSAEAIEWALNDQLWKKWLPALFTKAIRGTARVAIAVNDSITEGLGIAIRRAVEAPAKGLQLIQNGDVRWYLLFAVGSGFLILLHFAGVSG